MNHLGFKYRPTSSMFCTRGAGVARGLREEVLYPTEQFAIHYTFTLFYWLLVDAHNAVMEIIVV